jgi:hypothetical protein
MDHKIGNSTAVRFNRPKVRGKQPEPAGTFVGLKSVLAIVAALVQLGELFIH